MKRDLQNKFFELFNMLGLFDTSISVIKALNNLEWKHRELALSDNKLKIIDQDRRFLTEKYNQLIETGGFNVFPLQSLIDEIEDNYLELKEDKQLQYLYSIITKFKIYSDIFYFDKYYDNSKSDWLNSLQDSKSYWIQNKENEEAESQLEAIDYFEVEENQKKERLKMISDFFWNVDNIPLKDDCNIEYKVFNICRHLIHGFANLFDAFCLKNNLDLLELQKKCNVNLIWHHDLSLLQYYLGSMELAKEYLSKIEKDKIETIESLPPKYEAKYYALYHAMRILVNDYAMLPKVIKGKGVYQMSAVRDLCTREYKNVSPESFAKEVIAIFPKGNANIDLNNSNTIDNSFVSWRKKVLSIAKYYENEKVSQYINTIKN